MDASAAVPLWLRPLVEAAASVDASALSRFLPPEDGSGRPSAVLAAFAEGPRGPSVLLIQRAATLRQHAGQVAFPGGSIDPEDDGPVAAALREAREETGLDPATVEVLAQLPALFIPVSGFVVTAVIGWWRAPSVDRAGPRDVTAHEYRDVTVRDAGDIAAQGHGDTAAQGHGDASVPGIGVDPAEVARVELVALDELTDPAHRFTVTHPSGFVGPGFEAGGMFVWGFTAGLLDRMLALAGWERPWDRARRRGIPGGPS